MFYVIMWRYVTIDIIVGIIIFRYIPYVHTILKYTTYHVY